MYQTDNELASAMMTAREIAEYFRVSRTTIYRWIKAGIFPRPAFAATQKTRLWNRAEIMAWSRGGAAPSMPPTDEAAPASTPSDED